MRYPRSVDDDCRPVALPLAEDDVLALARLEDMAHVLQKLVRSSK